MISTRVKSATAGLGSTGTASLNGDSEGEENIAIVEYTGEYQERVTLGVYGDHGSGKSRLGATGPGPVGAVPLDQKAKHTIIETCRTEGKRIFLPNIDLVRVKNPMLTATLKASCQIKNSDGDVDNRAMDDITRSINIFKPQPMCCAIHHYRWHVNRTKYALVEMSNAPVETVIIDSGTNLWDDILFANHGRTARINPMDRAPDNREMQEILGICRNKHQVITHKEGEVWKNNKPTNEVEYKGYKHLGYEVGAILHMTRDKKTGQFRVDFEMCQANAALIGDAGGWEQTGLVDEGITFATVASAMYPGVDAEVWL